MWSNYPALHVVNGPSLLRSDSKSAVTTNVTQLYTPKETKIQLKWDAPGQKVGPDGMYTTVKPGGEGKYALFQQSYNIRWAWLLHALRFASITDCIRLLYFVSLLLPVS